MIKNTLQTLIYSALQKFSKSMAAPAPELTSDHIHLERPKDVELGDYATNIAFMLAKTYRSSPQALAEKIISFLPASSLIQNVQTVNGFINFFINIEAYSSMLHDIFSLGSDFGKVNLGQGQRIHLEFVSSNPTGPLHVGHGRGAAYGSILANLLTYVGYDVTREYYVNDAGRQMNILACSVWLRYLEHFGEHFEFPEKGYQGDYVHKIAEQLIEKYGKEFWISHEILKEKMAQDIITESPEANLVIDTLIKNAINFLGKNIYQIILDFALNAILSGIKQDLKNFGVEFETWFSERTLHQEGHLEKAIETLKKNGHVYEKDGALWFESTKFGDDKDRVIVRENGTPTYFAADIAHYFVIFAQNYHKVINIMGSDHHGYTPRVRAALQACHLNADQYIVRFVQFAILYRGKERVPMSTRSGSFITLAELVQEIGKDSARFFYVSKKIEQHMDFDLELAKSQSSDNPIFYIQYAHARICSVFRQLKEKGLSYEHSLGIQHFHQLSLKIEINLIKKLSYYPEIIEYAAIHYEPHGITQYLQELSQLFHHYYNNCQFLVPEPNLRNARLMLVSAVQQILKNSLSLLGISAPETM